MESTQLETTQLESNPIWLERPRPRFASLKDDARFDAIIIGGGITGLTAAWLLKQAGKKVVVFDKGRIGDAETGHTTAHLTCVTDTRLNELVRTFGEDDARAAWQGGAAAIDTIEAIINQAGLACHFQRIPGFLHAPLTKKTDDRDSLRKDAELARKLGFEAEFVESVPLVERPGVRFSNQAYFDPIEYLAGLARAIEGNGCEIHENTEVTDASDDPLSVVARGHEVRGHRIIVATHVPIVGLTNMGSATLLQTKLAGYSTYAIGGTVPRGSLPYASFWDTDDPYYYLRIDRRNGRDSIIFGGEDHKTGQAGDTEAHYAHLETVLRTIIPDVEIDHRWSGQVIESNDGLPFIGTTHDQQFVATGFAGNGMTFGTLAGMMACDSVLGRENPWQELFRVDRTKIRGGAWNYLKENVDYPWHLVKGFLKGTNADSLDALPKGEGRIVKVDGRRCAAFRSPEGDLKLCSAICTHMGCVVRWNGAEQTWDCPCHGSRFATDGHVLGGPAESPLEKIEPTTNA